MSDTVVIGGGVIGLSLAYELATRGAEVTLLERGRPGREASRVGAGIVTAGEDEAGRPAFLDLLRSSRRLLDEWSATLLEETGVDGGLTWCGALRVAIGEDEAEVLDRRAEAWRAAGIGTTSLDPSEVRELEPALAPSVTRAHRVPGEGMIDNPRHLEALTAACVRRGVRLLEGTPVTGFEKAGGRLRAAVTPGGPIPGDAFVAAAGAWTPRLVSPLGVELPGEPVRGQIVHLEVAAHPVRRIVWRGSRYLVPRQAGPLLVGSTMERAGFDARPTAEGVATLIGFARETVPELAGAAFARAEAGLRPGSADGLPFLGRAEGTEGLENLWVATGHSRSGIELSAGSARALADRLEGAGPDVDLAPFDPDRFRPDPMPTG